MAIEGPLRELGIHDVFQLIDLGRKSGVLRVSSGLRDDEGLVYFNAGRVTRAALRSKRSIEVDTPAPTRRLSVASSKRERDRLLRAQIESVVFELMAWTEGFLSFEERTVEDGDIDAITLSASSMLMEGARRIDEWSRIAQVVPSVASVPELAPVENGRDGPMLDLLPHEWQVLSIIDGARDVRGIAATLEREEFEISRIVYGLATTGVITVRRPRVATPANQTDVASRLATAHLDAALAAARAGDFAAARASCEQVLRLAPGDDAAARAQAALDALAQLERALEAHVYA